MTYQVDLTPAAKRTLRKLDATARRRIQGVIELLADTPRPPGAKKLAAGGKVWRVRTGEFRILYEIDDGALMLLVVALGHRRDIYRRR